MSDDERLRELAEALFPSGQDGLLGGRAPGLHVVRAEGAVICRTHRRLPRAEAGLPAGGLDEWVPDAASELPAAAILRDGAAVSNCASVRATAAVHCAWVGALLSHRSQGCGGAVVRAWAHGVRRRSAEPFYGTTFDNVASQRLARRSGLGVVASEFSVAGSREPAVPPRIADGG